MTPTSTILLQNAAAEHDRALRDLSRLDSARDVTRPALMAVVDGHLVAAASLPDGRIVADPFTESAEAVALLRVRTAEVRGDAKRRRALPLPRLRRDRRDRGGRGHRGSAPSTPLRPRVVGYRLGGG
jgi:hypothetical protein